MSFAVVAPVGAVGIGIAAAAAAVAHIAAVVAAADAVDTHIVVGMGLDCRRRTLCWVWLRSRCWLRLLVT